VKIGTRTDSNLYSFSVFELKLPFAGHERQSSLRNTFAWPIRWSWCSFFVY